MLIFSVALLFSPILTVSSADEATAEGVYFEGDMLLTEDQLDNLYSLARNGRMNEDFRWPNGIVPYVMSENHTKEQQDYIKKAFRKIESVSCVKFVPRTDQTDYVQMLASANAWCYSMVGHQRNKQVVNLPPFDIGVGCFRMGTILHELLHTLGFYHMQSSHDRDKYLNVHEENIRNSSKRNFIKYANDKVSHFGESYDYNSLMHYDAYSYSSDGKPTMEPKDPKYFHVIGQQIGLSKKDILKLNRMYNCDTSSLIMPPETEEIEQLVNNQPIKPIMKEKPRGSRFNKTYLLKYAKSFDSKYLLGEDICYESKDVLQLHDLILTLLEACKHREGPEHIAQFNKLIAEFQTERDLEEDFMNWEAFEQIEH